MKRQRSLDIIKIKPKERMRKRTFGFLKVNTSILSIVALLVLVVAPAIVSAVATPPIVWPTSWTTPAQCSVDPTNDENPSEIDLVGTLADPAVGFGSDANYQYFRERLDGDPGTPASLDQKAWVVLFQKTLPEYQFLGSVNGHEDKVQLWANSTAAGPVDFSPLLNDPAEGVEGLPTWEGASADYTRVTGVGSDFFLDWAIPVSVLSANGITNATTRFFATSADANNFNKDHLNCYESIANLSVTKTDSPDPVDTNGTLTYTITVTNNGPDTAAGVIVTDTLPTELSLTSVTPSAGSCSDTSAPTIQCELGSLNNAATATITIVGTVTSGTLISNSTSVTATTLDNDTSNNTATAQTTVNAVPTGTIIIVKDTVPDNIQAFDFTGDLGDFSLVDNGGSNSQTFSDLPLDTYSVSEDSIPGWDLTSATCDNGDEPSAITLGEDETITCIFENTQRGQIIVEKNVVGPDGQFTFSTDYSDDFILSDGQQDVSELLVPGAYSVAEEPDGDYTTTAACSDQSEPSAIVLDPGEIVTCTFTNVIKQGGITVVKQTFPTDSQETFEFAPSWDDNFTLTGNGASQNFTVDPGDYSVAEVNLPTGWDQTSVICLDQDDNEVSADGFTLAPDGSVTCTFTNTQLGKIIVVKDTVPDDSEDFLFTSGTLTPDEFSLDDDDNDTLSNTQEFADLAPGIYDVAESVSGNYVTTAVCDNQSPVTAIAVGAGQTVTCTFTNTYVPPVVNYTLTLTKSGDGEGTVNNDQENNPWCDSECEGNEQTYVSGTVVTLGAVPDEGSTFEGSWSGACTGTGSCVVTMTSNQTVNAHFALRVVSTPTPTTGGGGGGGGGPSYQAGLTFNSVAQKLVGGSFAESVVIKNTGNTPLSAGTLEITFPGQLTMTSSSPTAATYSGNVGTWSVPDINAGDSYTVSFVVSPASTGTTIISTAKYSINSSQIALVTASEDVGEVSGAVTTAPPLPEVAGAQTLPRTGTPVIFWILMLLTLISPLGFNSRKVAIRR